MLRRITSKETASPTRKGCHQCDDNRKERKYVNDLSSSDEQIKQHPVTRARTFIRLSQLYSKKVQPVLSIIICSSWVLMILSIIYLRIFGSTSNNNFDKPHVVWVNDDLNSNPPFTSSNNLLEYNSQTSSKRKIDVSEFSSEKQKPLEKSRKYRHSLWKGDCQPMHSWQETSFPTCNKFHEIHMEQEFTWIAEGGYNSVFTMNDHNNQTYIVKILGYEMEHTDYYFDKARRDSLIMERASRSPYIVDIYAFCGFAQITEFGKYGSLDDIQYETGNNFTNTEKLQIAWQVAQALSDVHNLDDDERSSMTHGDLSSKQFIFIDGRFKLNDFNAGKLLSWNPKTKEICPYKGGLDDGKHRSPEEYKHEPKTAAIDVWEIGSVFVKLLTGHRSDAGLRISKGKVPKEIPSKFRNSSDPIEKVLYKVIQKCHVVTPKDRPKAAVIANYLKNEAKRLNVDWKSPLDLKIV